MIASDWSKVQNIMECNRRCHWGYWKALQDGKTYQFVPYLGIYQLCPIKQKGCILQQVGSTEQNSVSIASLIICLWRHFICCLSDFLQYVHFNTIHKSLGRVDLTWVHSRASSDWNIKKKKYWKIIIYCFF